MRRTTLLLAVFGLLLLTTLILIRVRFRSHVPANPQGSGAAPASASSSSSGASDNAEPGTSVFVNNATDKDTVVFVAFGYDSKINAASWSSFCSGSGLNCSFPLKAKFIRQLPVKGLYLNATFSFNSVVTCGVTKAELNVNNPNWFDTADVSLVDGFSNFILIGEYLTVYAPKFVPMFRTLLARAEAERDRERR